MNKKIILGIIIGGIIFGSVGVYAGSNFYANGISVNAPTGSNLGSDATLQNSLDELYSIADKYDELNKKINSLKSDMLDEMYPVGSIYLSTSITTASDISKKFGGTWEAYGTGKTLVGVDTSNTNFNTVSKTGGSSTTTLSTSNLPSHSHSIPSLSGIAASNGAHTHAFNNGGIALIVFANSDDPALPRDMGFASSTNSWWSGIKKSTGSISSAGAHTHSVTTTASTSGSTGSGTSFTNLPPYITVYMYKRVK